jgi:hypothetical protein
MFFIDRERYIMSWLEEWLIFEWGAVYSSAMLSFDLDFERFTSALI